MVSTLGGSLYLRYLETIFAFFSFVFSRSGLNENTSSSLTYDDTGVNDFYCRWRLVKTSSVRWVLDFETCGLNVHLEISSSRLYRWDSASLAFVCLWRRLSISTSEWLSLNFWRLPRARSLERLPIIGLNLGGVTATVLLSLSCSRWHSLNLENYLATLTPSILPIFSKDLPNFWSESKLTCP